MQMTGEERIAAPRAKVWQALNDPAVLRQCIPGCQALEREPDGRLRATVEVKIGPIGARFNGVVSFSDVDAPNGYTITGEGQGGTVGHAKGGAKVRLADDNGGTRLSYEVEAQVGGRLAQLGGPIIDSTAKRLAGLFFTKFGGVVSGAAVAAPVQAAAGPPTAAAPGRASASGVPVAWILALVVAGFVGFLAGRGFGGVGSDGMGLAIGLLVLVTGYAGLELGRRAATPVVMLDPALLARLLAGAGQ